ncbi:hypothetical protein Dimus_002276 [Dionaea muscipula]
MDFDEERIGMVLVRASQLRSKFANSIHRTSPPHSHDNQHPPPLPSSDLIGAVGRDDPSSATGIATDADDEEEEEEEEAAAAAESVFNICDAFESLESQLASLQALQQQQQYEREAAIGEIEYSRKMLLKKLQEYKGEHLDVIQEASAFASMKIDHNTELLLPPYPSHAPHSLILDNTHLPHFSCKPTQNGHGSGETVYKATETPNESEIGHTLANSNSTAWNGLKLLVNAAAKAMLTLVGVVTVLSLTGYEPRIVRRDSNIKLLDLLQQPRMKEKRIHSQCSPGKVAVVEDGEVRCIVKERVEIPFSSVTSKPDVNYGCG